MPSQTVEMIQGESTRIKYAAVSRKGQKHRWDPTLYLCVRENPQLPSSVENARRLFIVQTMRMVGYVWKRAGGEGFSCTPSEQGVDVLRLRKRGDHCSLIRGKTTL